MFPSKPLPTLFADYPARTRIPAIEITAIAVDSRKVTPGDLFVATSDQIDGHQYISHAIENGAVAALGTQVMPDLPIPYIQVEDS
ncbi:MAG: UDP-N-acetylmuramoyl-tripeptide--D-alanyl-D-alanine ligase, partial [Chloroflexi bacterium]|nr:UDP-N-acetylmuramoyl-tripeptide--D-alanyl-D-alanine ligase [Chloroflexota bacterium]